MMMRTFLTRGAAGPRSGVVRAATASAASPLRAFATVPSGARLLRFFSSATSAAEAGEGKAANEGVAANKSDELLSAAKAEAEELKKQLQYALADRENIRRILMRDVKDAKEYGMREFAKDLLDVSDNFERALAAAKADADRLPEVKALYDGVAMTEQQLHKVFDRYGIKRTSPLGEKFNPQTHAALMELHSDEHADGHVAVVIKSGFLMKDRVLRPAEVGVVKKKPQE